MEGLLAKVWLADPASNTYGGVYTFASEADLDRFLSLPAVRRRRRPSQPRQPEVRRFQVLEEPTRVTHGLSPSAADPGRDG